MPDGKKTGELYFYYIPKGILKKKPVNVYEIPNKFNLDENEYLALVKYLYEGIKQVREEFRKSEITGELWSNITITIQNLKFKVEYNYEDLLNSYFNNYERHIIWRYEYLGIGQEQVSKKDREILERYFKGAKEPVKKDIYESGIYIKDVGNQIGYNTEEIEKPKEPQEPKKRRNQILLSEEEVRKMKNLGGN